MFIIGLGLGSSLSPLLTFSKLFQMKEWRFDRLREHLRSEGWFRSLFGVLRPVMVGCLLILIIILERPGYLALGLLLLTCLTLAQILLRRQPRPVWTAKALVIVALGLLVNTALSLAFGMRVPILLLLLPVGQPLIVTLACILLLPLDRFLKKRAMDRAATLRASHPHLVTIGVTGSVGKTTTKELLAHLLAERGAAATPEYVNSEMGVAQWISRVLASETPPKILIVEMGAYRQGEIRRLCAIAQPSIGIITAVGTQHLGLFGSEEAIQDAKAELLEALPKKGHAFVNAESAGARAIAGRAPCALTTVGITQKADLMAEQVNAHDSAMTIRITGAGFETAPLGAHNATNVLLAIAAARHLGMKDDEIRARLASFRPLPHTFSLKVAEDVLIVDDTHNASPQSVQGALDWARHHNRFRPRTLLLSGLLELGSAEARIMRELGERARGCVERVIFIGERGRGPFAEGFGGPVEILRKGTAGVPRGSVLLALGRMPLSSIQKLLPRS